jgi:hypothetical protein
MLSPLKAIAVGFLSIAASALALNVGPAFACDDAPGIPNVIRCKSPDYAEYYAPYAIQAAASYVNGLDKKFISTRGVDEEQRQRVFKEDAVRHTFTSDEIGADVQKEFGASLLTIRKHAEDALEPWQYQFGSRSYLSCYDRADEECKRALPSRWYEFQLSAGPAFDVWARRTDAHVLGIPVPFAESCEFSIAFRGTRPTSLADWGSDARYVATYLREHRVGTLLRSHGINIHAPKNPYDDAYRQLRRNIDAIIRDITTRDCYRHAISPQIVAVGHSLGGGLAQLAALADKTEPRIDKVFAFDSHKETGRFLVDNDRLKVNVGGLTIDRVLQKGELVSVSVPGEPYPPSDSLCNPLVRTVEYDVLKGNAVAKHSIVRLAAKLLEINKEAKPTMNEEDTRTTSPPGLQDCVASYHFDRTHIEAAPLAAASPISPPAQLRAAESSAQRRFYALVPRQLADPSQQQTLFVPPSTQAAGMGARGVHYAPAQPQFADLGQRQALIARQPTQGVDIGGRQARSSLSRAEITDRGARGASAHHLIAHNHYVLRIAVSTPDAEAWHKVYTARNRNSAVASAL